MMPARVEVSFVRCGAVYSLKIVSVEMERMLSCIVVIEDDLDDIALVQYMRVCIAAVDGLV